MMCSDSTKEGVGRAIRELEASDDRSIRVG